MTAAQKEVIENISRDFANGFKPEIEKISGSGWLIVDPLSAFLAALGYANTLKEIPAKGNQAQVLVIIFQDGTQFIPAGSDINIAGTKDWMWLDND